MKIKRTYTVWGTEPNAMPLIPDILVETVDEREALRTMEEAILAGYTNVGIYKGGKPVKVKNK